MCFWCSSRVRFGRPCDGITDQVEGMASSALPIEYNLLLSREYCPILLSIETLFRFGAMEEKLRLECLRYRQMRLINPRM